MTKCRLVRISQTLSEKNANGYGRINMQKGTNLWLLDNGLPFAMDKVDYSPMF